MALSQKKSNDIKHGNHRDSSCIDLPDFGRIAQQNRRSEANSQALSDLAHNGNAATDHTHPPSIGRLCRCLPPVSYITRIDRFILLSTFMVFASLMQTVATTVLVRKKDGIGVERIDRWSRVIYPVILVIVLVISFAI